MATLPQDPQLRALIEETVTKLAEKIRGLILDRLLVPLSGAPAPARPVASAPPQKVTVTKPKKKPAARQAGSSRKPADAAVRRDKILAVFAGGKALSASEVAKAAGLDRGTVDYSLQLLRKSKKVFMAGTRGSARWATSAEVAKKAVAG